VIAALLLASLAAIAAPPEVIEVSLPGGRTLAGERLPSPPGTLRLGTHQGIIYLEGASSLEVTPLSRAEWEAAPPWRVWAPEFGADPGLEGQAGHARELVLDALAGFPGVVTPAPGGRELTAARAEALAGCGLDAACALPIAREAGLDVVILGEVGASLGADDELALTAIFTEADQAWRAATIPWQQGSRVGPVSALNVTCAALGLEPDPTRVDALVAAVNASTRPAPAPTPADVPPPPTNEGLTRGQVMGLAFVPIPGFPSLFQRDLVGFGLSWAAAAPAGVIFVGATGATASRRGQLVGVGLAGAYVLTVSVNQVMGVRSLEGGPVIGITPSGDGAVARLTTSW
jgi:hypothetical protein